jgi:TonB-linked SusC/RagA family outer membrane protein
MIMKSIIYNIKKSFHRNAFCLIAVGLAMPVFAQDDLTDEEVAAAPKRPKVEQEKYQLKTVKGVILDEVTKKPLGGIQVKALGNSRYTAMSDDDGTFTIKVPVFTTSLYVYAQEFSAQQVGIDADKEDGLVVYMLSDKFRPMYNDGTSITASRDFTATGGHNFTIDTEIENRLSGDLRSIQRSGSVGIGNNMFIRGLNSINANSQPLVIVDGVEMDMQLGREMLHSGNVNNMLANVMPSDIEKVTVLKNATALYGARGGNGVILIDTKRGHSMATRIDANISVGLSLVPRLQKMMNASQYRNYATEILGTIDGIDKNTPSLNFLNDDPNGYYYHTYHNDFDWQDAVYHTALTQNYSINVQGGDDVGMYNLSVGYVDGESTAKGNDYNRMNVRFNTDIDILKNLKTKFNMSISRTTTNSQNDGVPEDFSKATPTSPTFLAAVKSPLVTPYQYNTHLGGFSSLLSESDDLFDAIGKGYSLANPVAILEKAEGVNRNYTENTYFQTMIAPTLKLGRDWSITEMFSYVLNRNSQRYTRPSTGVPGFELKNLGTVYNQFSTLFSNENNIVSDTRVDFSHIFGAHTLSAYAGFRYNYFSFDSDAISTQYTSRQDDKNPHISASSSDINTSGGANDVWKQIQWYGNIDYNFMNRYFLTLSLLGEANSRFGVECDGLDLFGAKWELYPSVQAGWVATNEKWFPKNAGINYLRINAGYDVSGNDDIMNNAARTIYAMTKYNGFPALQLVNIGNDKIQSEKTHKFNVGFQSYLLHNRIGVSFDYYIHKTTNLLTMKSFSDPISGINSYWTNGGELKNTGFEAAVSVKPVVSKNWNVELGASVGHYKNEVTKLPDGDYTSSIYGKNNILTSVGNPVAMFYGYKTAGVFADDAAAKSAGKDGYLYIEDNTGQRHDFKAGDVHFVDKDGNGIIDDNDRFVIGDPNPDIYGNIFATVNWKNFTLSMNFNYSLGNDVFNYQRMIFNSGSNFYNQQVAMTNHWRYEGQVTDMPRVMFNDPMGNNRFSDRWIEDGSYLRLKTLKLAYRVPVNFTWLQGLSVWAEAVNLFTLTKYLGNDPEFSINNGVMYQGIDCGNLAQGRAFTLGMKINL